jgi:sterol 3beta-glucosyltransferase
MKITVTTGGTLGDVVPFCAIAKALARKGHDVLVATNSDYQSLVESHGLRFAQVFGSFRAVIETPLGRAWNSTDSPRHYLRLTRELLVPLMPQALADLRAATLDADLVLFHPFHLGAYHTAEARGIPAVLLAMVPWAASAEIDSLLLPGVPGIGWLRRLLLQAWMRGFCDLFRESHDTHRASIGLLPFRERDYYAEIFAKGVPIWHLFSPSLVPRPRDWPEGIEVVGFCDLPGQDAGFEPSAELARFLDQGEPPVYIGFGSTTGDKPEALNPVVFGALERLGCRAIVAGGWCGLGSDAPLPPEGRRVRKDVFVVPYIPHSWVFPRVRAVVHHGSTGSLSAGLRAGRPTLVIPFFGDQPFWGRRAFACGVGPRPVRRRGLTAERLAAAMDDVMSNPRYGEGAAAFAQKLAGEDGAERVAEYVEKFASGSRVAGVLPSEGDRQGAILDDP